jgi:hypothetical protein
MRKGSAKLQARWIRSFLLIDCTAGLPLASF